MEEKKQIKISLGTSICLFIIVLLVIALVGMGYYYNKVDKTEVMREKEENLNKEEVQNSTIEEKNNNGYKLELGEYNVDQKIVDESGVSYDECGIILEENDKFKLYMGWGAVLQGEYEVRSNNLVCRATERLDQIVDPISTDVVITFKIINSKKIELLEIKINDTKNEKIVFDEAFKKGMTYSIKTIDEKETISKLSKEDTYFVIEDIKKKEDKYEITAYILEKEARRLSEEEYNKILNGDKFTFRGTEWKLKEMQGSKGYESSAMLVTSGDELLYVLYDTETKEFCIENVAGTKSGGLRDYSEEKITFAVDEDIYVGGYWTSFENDNGKIKIKGVGNEEGKASTIKELIEWTSDSNATGTYEECIATIIDGKVVAIQMFYK